MDDSLKLREIVNPIISKMVLKEKDTKIEVSVYDKEPNPDMWPTKIKLSSTGEVVEATCIRSALHDAPKDTENIKIVEQLLMEHYAHDSSYVNNTYWYMFYALSPIVLSINRTH